MPGARSGPAPEPLVCRRCSVQVVPIITPGSGPHALKGNCPHCGGFLKWLSRLTPQERARRRERARLEAMAQYPPTPRQLDYLTALGDQSPMPPANQAEASQRIDQLKKDKGVA
jgi:hypothetical protein